MYHTIEIVDFTKPVRLEKNTIDNRSGKLKISLKSVNLWVNYNNVRKKSKIVKRKIGEGVDPIDNFQFIEPGPDFTKLVFTYDASRGLRCIAALRVVADAMCSTIHFTKHIVRATRSNPV